MTATCPLEHFLAQSAVDKVNPQDGGIEKVGLDKMPDKWYEQAQLVLWPMDTPTDPFQHYFLTCTHGITMLSWWEYMPSSCGLPLSLPRRPCHRTRQQLWPRTLRMVVTSRFSPRSFGIGRLSVTCHRFTFCPLCSFLFLCLKVTAI